jgi:tRNA (cytidine/uridine-2'-O-)-methyltransferase
MTSTINIVLVEPEIPPNTGNIIRLCANTGAALHVVKPMGFEIDHKRMRRAGLDYREFVDMAVHENWQQFKQHAGTDARMMAVTTKGSSNAFEHQFTQDQWLIFGPETRGLSDAILGEFDPSDRLRIPMQPENRSLNLSNAVAILTYEAWRQQGFAGAI